MVGFIREELKEKMAAADAMPEQKVIIKGRTYRNIKKAEVIDESKEIAKSYGKWVAEMPDLAMLFVTSIAFGALGGVTKSVYELSKKQLKYNDPNVLLNPFFGILMGLLTLGLSHLLPIMFSSGETEIRKTTLIFFALFAGLFSDQFISAAEKRFTNLINRNNE